MNLAVFKNLIQTALYCNDSVVGYEKGKRKLIGNPTEGDLLDLVGNISLNEKPVFFIKYLLIQPMSI